MKFSLILILIAFSSLNANSAQQITDFIKDSNGERLMLSQSDASEYCKSLGYRLPSARNYAEQMVGLKKGLIENTDYPDMSIYTSYVQLEMKWWADAGYISFAKRKDAETLVIDFYYKHHNWPPAVDFDWVWTGGGFDPHPYYTPYSGLVFNPKSKRGFETDNPNNRRLFRCVMP